MNADNLIGQGERHAWKRAGQRKGAALSAPSATGAPHPLTTEDVCSCCSFWGRDRHGSCSWCGEPANRPPSFLSRKWSQVKRLVRIGKRVARDRRVPRWLRWTILGGIVAGPFLLGPFDEILVACLIAFVVYRYPGVWKEHAAMVDEEAVGV